MKLIQGGNAPIILEFDEPLYDYPSISIGLYTMSGEAKKLWTKEDLEFSGTTVICPLSPEETKDFSGVLVLSMKILADNGSIIFFQEEHMSVTSRKDKDIDL